MFFIMQAGALAILLFLSAGSREDSVLSQVESGWDPLLVMRVRFSNLPKSGVSGGLTAVWTK